MTSGIGRFPTDFCSRRIRSTSERSRVFPSIAFVPHVFSAPVRFQTSSGKESSGLRVSNSALRVANMLFRISRFESHIDYLDVYVIRQYTYHRPSARES